MEVQSNLEFRDALQMDWRMLMVVVITARAQFRWPVCFVFNCLDALLLGPLYTGNYFNREFVSGVLAE